MQHSSLPKKLLQEKLKAACCDHLSVQHWGKHPRNPLKKCGWNTGLKPKKRWNFLEVIHSLTVKKKVSVSANLVKCSYQFPSCFLGKRIPKNCKTSHLAKRSGFPSKRHQDDHPRRKRCKHCVRSRGGLHHVEKFTNDTRTLKLATSLPLFLFLGDDIPSFWV